MRAPEIQWTLWALLPILSTSFSAAAAPTSCSEMDSTYEGSVYAFNVNCNAIAGNPATYAYYSLGDTFASCVERCDLDDVCIAVNYQHFTGDCDLVAAFTQLQPSSDYDVAVKAYALSIPITSTSLTTDVVSTTDSATLQSSASTSETLSVSEYTSLPTTALSSDEVSTSAFTSLPETLSSSDVLSTTDYIPLPLTTSSDEVSISAFTSILETTSTSDVLSTVDFTSLPSTEFPSSTATTSDFMSTSSDYTSAFPTSSFTSFLSTETFTSESTLAPTISDSFVSSSMYLSGSTTVEDVTASSLTSSVLTFLTLSTSAAVAESSTITSVSVPSSSTTESTSVPPTTSTADTVTIIASTTADSSISNTKTVISSNDIVIKTSETTVLTDIATATTTTTACTIHATLTDTITSVTYVTVDSSLSVVTTCVPVTLLYSPCSCEHETYPTVDMVTVTSPCSIYSSQGKVTTTLTVPRACETLTSDGQPAIQYPSGWILSQMYSGHGSYYLTQPTAGSQTNSWPGSKQPEMAVPVLKPEAVSVKGRVSTGGVEAAHGQPKATQRPSSEVAPTGDYHPEATADQSIPVASQLTGSPQSSVNYEQIPGKVPNATETLSLSWTTRHGNHQPSAAASKTGSTDEIAQSIVPSVSGAKGSTPITVSGASRPSCVVWAIIGLILMFY